jgi:hypothetical protein
MSADIYLFIEISSKVSDKIFALILFGRNVEEIMKK